MREDIGRLELSHCARYCWTVRNAGRYIGEEEEEREREITH